MNKTAPSPFVSRAGVKLRHALTVFGVSVTGKVCADLGCSTGGFTDCLLHNGAAKVYAVDTGKGILDWKLRTDPRVIVREGENALHVALPEPVDLVTIDTGWTKQEYILPHALTLLKTGGQIISLVKPHYEAPKQWLTKGRLEEQFVHQTVELVKEKLTAGGMVIHGITESPIVGAKGRNKEYLLLITN